MQIFGVSTANAQDDKVTPFAPDIITIGLSGSIPPFSMTDAASKIEDFDVDVVNLVAKHLGLTAKF